MSTIPEKRDRVNHFKLPSRRERLLGMLVVMLFLLLAIALRSL